MARRTLTVVKIGEIFKTLPWNQNRLFKGWNSHKRTRPYVCLNESVKFQALFFYKPWLQEDLGILVLPGLHDFPKSKQNTSKYNTMQCKVRLSRTLAKEVHPAGAYPSFCSMKQLRVLLLPPGWDASPSQGKPQQYVVGTHAFYTPEWRDTMWG